MARFAFHSRKVRFIRSARVYLWRAFCVLFVFCAGVALLYTASPYFRSKVLASVDKYSNEFGYSVQAIELQHENSADYCVTLDEQELLAKYKGLSMILFPASELKAELEAVDCVEKVSIRKIFPTQVQLSVSYKAPAALWQEGKVFYFLTRTGSIMKIRSDKNISDFILITGGAKPADAIALLDIISADQDLYSQVSTAAWVGDRRWNITFNNGTKLMLPEESPNIAWNRFKNIQQSNQEFKDWKYKVVDVRIANKIYAR